MNILELDSYNLDDAVKFHDHLNPRLWDEHEHLRPDVREALLKIAEDFREFLGVNDLSLKDITVSGSNAAYTYTPNSDIDLHLVIDAPNDEVYRELFDAKKYAYNDQHDIKIGGYDVELYVEDYGNPPKSQGIYSVQNNEWVSVPRRGGAKVDDANTKQKFETLGRQIELAIKSKKLSRLTNLFSKIKKMRQTGLESHGEFGPENLAFKMLRNQGLIEKLVTARNEAKAQELSLKEKSTPQPFKYGFKTLVDEEGSTPDGVSPSTCMFLDNEEPEVKSDEDILKDFIDFCVAELKIEDMPTVKLRKDPQWPVVHRTFGRYINDKHMLEVAWGSRHIMDVLRTVAHELTHKHQHERDGENMGADAGETGSKWENEANARAGILMRDYARLHPDYFAVGQAEELHGDEVDEGALSKAAMAAALAAGLSGPAPAHAQSAADAVNTARAAYNLRNITQAGVRDEMSQELRNYIRAQGGDPGSQNQSHLYKLQNRKPQQVVYPQQDAPTNAPAMPMRRGQQNESASGYIPTKKQAKDPRYSMALTVDIKPGQVGKEANKLGLETDKQGKPALVMKARNQLAESLAEELALFEEQDLFEINMGSKNLRKEAAKTGAIAGMEFEMIVPNVEGGEDDVDFEPDWDMDEGVSSIQDAFDFFYDGDYNSRRDCERLREQMQESYWEWLGTEFDSRWESDEAEFVYNYLVENAGADDIIELLDLEGGEAEEVSDTGPTKQDYRNATERVVDAGYGNYWYDQARESAQEEFNQDADLESEWLESADLGTMRDVQSSYDISWPHYYQPNGGGESSIEDVAQDFEDRVGRDTKASGSYHSGRVERPGPNSLHYIVEPDGSLEGDNSGDQGLEFVSPPLPIDEILGDLNKVKRWAKEYGCYTNDSTGLHINISVPNYSRENLDFVKLAILMGDEYVLKSFGRSGNTYAKSAMKLVRDEVRNKPDAAQGLLDKMKGNLDSLASKAIHSGITSKYTSINTKDGHIEFRSPGGDWLDENFDQIENTLMRFTVAMSAALNPEMYREEYLKKLYKLLTQDEKGSDTIKYFTEYVAGKIPKAALRSFVKQAQLERKLKKGSAPTGEKYWWNVQWDANRRMEVVAGSAEVAKQVAAEEWGVPESQLAGAKVTALRPYKEPQYKEPTGNAELDAIHRELGLQAPSSGRAATSSTGQWKIVDGLNREVYRFRPAENTRAKANELAALWARENNFDGNYQVDPVEDSGQTDQQRQYTVRDASGYSMLVTAPNPNSAMQWARENYPRQFPSVSDVVLYEPTVSGSTMDLAQQRTTPGTFTGAWKIVDANGNELYRFSGIGNQQRDANRLATQWMQNNGYDYGTEIEVLPIMSESLEEGWKDVAIGAAMGLGALGAGTAQAKPVKAPQAQVQQVKKTTPQVKAPQARVTPAAKAVAPAAKEPEVKPGTEINLLSDNPQKEALLHRTALRAGLKGTELAQFLAQTRHESADFRSMKERFNGKDAKTYFMHKYDKKYAPQTAKILGNTQVGDGFKYHGRGYIQLTGRDNYTRAANDLGIDLVNHPELASTPEVAAKLAVWYWKTRVKPAIANFADTTAVTRLINPAMRGLQDRHSNFLDYKQLI